MLMWRVVTSRKRGRIDLGVWTRVKMKDASNVNENNKIETSMV